MRRAESIRAGQKAFGLRNDGERVVPEWVDSDDRFSQVQFAQHLHRYERVAGEVRGLRVLDLGCGVGYGAAMLSDAGAAHVRAVDVSAAAIAYAEGHYGREDVEFAVQPVGAVEGGGEFDVVTCFEVLEHLEDPGDCWRAAHRALAPGGRLYLSASVFPTMDLYRFHLRDYTAASLRAAAHDAGFDVVDELYQVESFSPDDVRQGDRNWGSFPWRRFLTRPHRVIGTAWRAISRGTDFENLMLVCCRRGEAPATVAQADGEPDRP